MRFTLPEEHALLRQMVRDFVAAEVAPVAGAWEDGLPDAATDAVAALGLLGVLVPEAQGGAGMDPLAYAIAVEELAAGDGGLALLVALHAGPCVTQLAGREVVSELASGARLGAWGDDLVPARAELVCGATLGAAGAPVSTYGMRSARLAPKVPGEALPECPEAAQMAALGVAAVAVGLSRAATEHGARYALDRKQFGTPIAEFQASQWKIADAATAVSAARLLVHRAAAQPQTVSMALAFAADAARIATDAAIQLHGGYGYTREYPVERFWRDAKYCQVAVGGRRAHRLAVAGRALR